RRRRIAAPRLRTRHLASLSLAHLERSGHGPDLGIQRATNVAGGSKPEIGGRSCVVRSYLNIRHSAAPIGEQLCAVTRSRPVAPAHLFQRDQKPFRLRNSGVAKSLPVCWVPEDWLDGIGVDRGISYVRERRCHGAEPARQRHDYTEGPSL